MGKKWIDVMVLLVDIVGNKTEGTGEGGGKRKRRGRHGYRRWSLVEGELLWKQPSSLSFDFWPWA